MMMKTAQDGILVDGARFSHSFHNRVKKIVESHPDYTPSHFGTLTFYPSSPVGDDLDWATRTTQEFFIKVAHKTNTHNIPIAAIGQTELGRWHIHYNLLCEKGRRTPKYRELKNLWVNGNKRGWQKNKRYNPDLGGIIYTLRHELYIPVTAPFCPNASKCKPTCVKQHRFEDIIQRTLRLTEETTACWPSMVPEGAAPLYRDHSIEEEKTYDSR